MTLYRQKILEHMRSPQNFGKLKQPQAAAEVDNPLCGDRVKLELELSDQGEIKDLRFRGAGCAITIASASMFTEAIKGKKVKEVAQMDQEAALKLMEIEVTPARVSCATLALAAIQEAFRKWDDRKK